MNDQEFDDFLDVYIKRRLEGESVEAVLPGSGVKLNELDHEQRMGLFFWEYMIACNKDIAQMHIAGDEVATKIVRMLFQAWDSRGDLEKILAQDIERQKSSLEDILEKFEVETEKPN